MATLKDTIVLGKLSVLEGIHSRKTISGNEGKFDYLTAGGIFSVDVGAEEIYLGPNDEVTISNGLVYTSGSEVDCSNGTLTIKALKALTSSSTTSTTYGLGTSGQVLKSNGTNAYWGSTTAGLGNPVLIAQYDTDGSGQCTASALTNFNFYEIVISYTDDYWFSGTRGFVSKIVSRQSLMRHADGTLIPIYDGGAATERMGGLVQVTMNSSGSKMSWSLVERGNGSYFYNYDDTSTDFRFKIYGIPIAVS